MRRSERGADLAPFYIFHRLAIALL
jgi:hypothetical protein